MKISALVPIAIAVVTLCAGCSSQPAGSQRRGSSAVSGTTVEASTSSVPLTSSATLITPQASPTTSTSRTSTGGTALPAGCTFDELTASVAGPTAAAGTMGFTITFTNRGSRTCTISGYPGVAAVSPRGAEVMQAARAGDNSAPPVIRLSPRQAARASLQVNDNPCCGNNPPPCPEVTALDITPPGATRTTRISVYHFSACRNFQVEPVRP